MKQLMVHGPPRTEEQGWLDDDGFTSSDATTLLQGARNCCKNTDHAGQFGPNDCDQITRQTVINLTYSFKDKGGCLFPWHALFRRNRFSIGYTVAQNPSHNTETTPRTSAVSQG
eukprot:2441258-Amphidinium_carterae.1